MTTPAERIADLEDIRMLSARYARGLDRFSMPELLEPFADDAVFDASPMGLSAYTGKAALEEFFAHNQEVMADQMHLFGNFIIELSDEVTAHGTSYLLQDGHTKDGSTVRCFCINEDTYSKASGTWRIASRTVRPLMPPQLEAY